MYTSNNIIIVSTVTPKTNMHQVVCIHIIYTCAFSLTFKDDPAIVITHYGTTIDYLEVDEYLGRPYILYISGNFLFTLNIDNSETKSFPPIYRPNSQIFQIYNFAQVTQYNPKIGILLCVDSRNHFVYKIYRGLNATETWINQTICNGEFKSIDGNTTECSFQGPTQIVTDSTTNGSIIAYVAEYESIRTIHFNALQPSHVGTLVEVGARLMDIDRLNGILYAGSGIMYKAVTLKNASVTEVFEQRPTDVGYPSPTSLSVVGDGILIASEQTEDRLLLIDVHSKSISLFCPPTDCTMEEPSNVLVYNSTVVVVSYKPQFYSGFKIYQSK